MKGFWRDRKSKLHKISEMPKPYLLNCIKSLRKSMEDLVDAVGGDCEDLPEYKSMAKQYLELVDEFFNRLHKYHPYDKSIPLSKVYKLEETDMKDAEDKEFWNIIQGGGLNG